LKALAKELDVPVIAVAMVGRGSEKHGDKRPMLSDLRESGQIEGDADVILFIHREEYYHSEEDEDVERGIAEIIIAKNREGATGTRKLAYLATYTRFDNLAVERN
jgi:replicative DNA helicase